MRAGSFRFMRPEHESHFALGMQRVAVAHNAAPFDERLLKLAWCS